MTSRPQLVTPAQAEEIRRTFRELQVMIEEAEKIVAGSGAANASSSAIFLEDKQVVSASPYET
jgi:hypothetical protein